MIGRGPMAGSNALPVAMGLSDTPADSSAAGRKRLQWIKKKSMLLIGHEGHLASIGHRNTMSCYDGRFMRAWSRTGGITQ
jgi:hypothetical protein